MLLIFFKILPDQDFFTRIDRTLRALSTLRGLRGAPAVSPLCREAQSLGQQMVNVTVGKNGFEESKRGSATQTGEGGYKRKGVRKITVYNLK